MPSRPSMSLPFLVAPIAVAAAAGLVVVPISALPAAGSNALSAGSNALSATPNALAAVLMSHSRQLADDVVPALGSVAADIASVGTAGPISAVSLLAHSPAVLRTVSTGELARFVVRPEATAPLIASAAAADPTADLLAGLQSAFGKILDAVNAAPTDVITSFGQLLGGDLRTAMQTLSNIVIKPLTLIGLLDLPNITGPLAQLAPFFAPVINAIPDVAINVTITALQLYVGVREGVADTFEGVRAGLVAGDVGAAAAKFVSGLGAIAQTGLQNLLGPNGFVSALIDSGNQLLTAISQIGVPVAKTAALAAAPDGSTAARALNASAPADPDQRASAGRSGTAKSTAAGLADTEKADGSATSTPESTKPESTKPDSPKSESTKLESGKPESGKPESSKSESTKSESSKPESTKPESTKPESTKSESSKPESTKPESTKPESSQPKSGKPDSGKPESGQAGTSGKGASASSRPAASE